jgi:hypothetical protein
MTVDTRRTSTPEHCIEVVHRQGNQQVGSAGCQVWAPDYFDRFIRDRITFAGAIRCIEENPVKAGLAKRPQDWPFSSATSRARMRAGRARSQAIVDGLNVLSTAAACYACACAGFLVATFATAWP